MASTIKTNLELDSRQFTASAKSAKRSIDDLKDESSRLADQLNAAAKAEDIASVSIGKVRKDFNAAKIEIQNCALKLQLMGEAAKDTAGYQDIQQQMEAAREKARRLKNQIDEAKDSIEEFSNKSKGGGTDSILGKLGEDLGIDIKGITGNFGKFGSIINGIDDTINNVTKGFEKFAQKAAESGNDIRTLGGLTRTAGTSLGSVAGSLARVAAAAGPVVVGITAVVGGLIMFAKVTAEAIEKSGQFEQAIANLSALTGSTGKDLEDLTSRIESLGQSTNTRYSDIAKNFELIAGAMPDLLQNAEGLQRVSDAAILLSKVTGGSLEEATNSLTTVMGQFGLKAENASYAVDVLANAEKYGAATADDVAKTLKVCGTAADTAGISLKEAAAATELLATKQIKAEVAGTALRNVFMKMMTSGIDEINPQVVGLTAALEELQKKSTTELKGLFGEEGVTAAMIMSNNTAALTELTSHMEEFGAAQDSASTKSRTMVQAQERLSVAWDNLMSSFTGVNGIITPFIDGITMLVGSLGELIHSFDGLFDVNLETVFDLDPVSDFFGIISEVVGIVADLIKGIIQLSGVGKETSAALRSGWIGLGAPLKLVRELLEWIRWGLNSIISAAASVRSEIQNTFAKIPGLDYLQKTLESIYGWLRDVKNAYNDLKKSLGVGGESNEDSSTPVKPAERTQIDESQKPYEKGSLADIEAQIQRLETIRKNGNKDDVKKANEKLKTLYKQKKAIEDTFEKDPYSKSGKKETGAAGSLKALEEARSKFEDKWKSGKLQIDDAEALAKLAEFDSKIKNMKLSMGLVGDVEALENKLSEMQSKYSRGLLKLSPEAFTDEVNRLEREISRRKFELNIGPAPDSETNIQAVISKLQNILREGRKFPIKIIDSTGTEHELKSAEDALSRISQERSRLTKAKWSTGEIANRGEELSEDLKNYQEDYRLGLRIDVDPSSYKKTVEQFQKDIKSANILLGIDLDKDKADKDLKQQLEDFNREMEGGSSFNIAIGQTPVTLNNPKDNESQLDAIETQMDANDELISQLKQMLTLYESFGQAGAAAAQEITAKITELNTEQSKLGEQAKVIDSSNKKQKKFTKSFESGADAVSSMGDAMSSLGSAFEDPALNVAGIIAQSIANLALSASQAILQSASLGPWGWVAFGAAAIAQLAAMTAQLHSITGFASGGIVSGGYASGDKLYARLNSGEMVMNSAQQQRLWRILSGQNSLLYGAAGGNSTNQVEFIIRGSDLVGSIKNYQKMQSKIGKQISLT